MRLGRNGTRNHDELKVGGVGRVEGRVVMEPGAGKQLQKQPASWSQPLREDQWSSSRAGMMHQGLDRSQEPGQKGRDEISR